MKENDISYKIRGAIYKVYNGLGPGLLESAYKTALIYQLEKDGLKVKSEVPIDIVYKGLNIPMSYKLDILVEDTIIIELKSVEGIKDVHYKQLLTYLKLKKLHLGLLVNFNVYNINDGIIRIVNGYSTRSV